MSFPPTKTFEKLNNPMKSPLRAESPTTVRPLEMDDDDFPETPPLGSEALSPRLEATTAPKHATVEDEPPLKPQRPLSPQQQAENTLKEAFPNIDVAVVKAVLRASSGNIEPAFNALLGMSDPEAVQDPSPTPPQGRTLATNIGSTPLSQLEADEQFARQLAQQYGSSSEPGLTGQLNLNSRNIQSQRAPAPSYRPPVVQERSFLDDELPIIRDNLKKGFLETQNKVTGWITTLKKKIDGDDENDNMPYGYGSTSRPRRSYEDGRTGDYNRYDADPQVLGDDLGGIQLNPDGALTRQSHRQQTSQNQPESESASAQNKSAEKISASSQAKVSEENDIYDASPKSVSKNPPKQSKWQPLTTVEPSSTNETDHDPFSLGDSEDEKDVKDRFGGRLKKLEDPDLHSKNDTENLVSNITKATKDLSISEKVHDGVAKN